MHKKQLIVSLMKREIDISKFYNDFNAFYGEPNICYELELARQNRDAELVDVFLYFSALINYDFKCIDLLNELIIADWHKKHEDLATILNYYHSETSVEYLYQAALLELNYRDYDEDYVLADKCIRALAKIKNKNSIEKLERLAMVENEKIKKSAMKQLSKIS
ncbi:hypothetical protein [Klebsiella aerogenes]|uniref:hypothetical protein n=1 Tax=Klebsiella aerogenes TaxID=548 RepID=UPI0021B0F730|nr:hypothetical protein [Klebsiella aerogenes]